MAILKEMGSRIQSEENRATNHPIFEVRELRVIWGMNPAYTDDYKWIDVDDCENIADKDRHELLDKMERNDQSTEAWEKVYFVEVEVSVQPFFTEEGANNYIRRNRHNLRKPFTYVQSAHRNPEWQAVRDHLLSMTPKTGDTV